MIVDNKEYKYIFLDRDGVINVERKDDYAKNISEFVFEENALTAISLLSRKAESLYIITNQRGVGHGIMSLGDLNSVHTYMHQEIESEGGKIKGVYFCTDIDSSSINRKPNIGMAFQAHRDFPEIEFSKSIMVGNSKSDIEFGNKLGMYTVLVGNKYPKDDEIYQIADVYYSNLYEFALSLQ
jgi:D-glycero-D-manno-heptose 1,7-bisphosphate phosphatase